ncbi:DNA/RNA non-specific endonuclease [Formosa algae]|uniref:Endonuclease G n=1 Tax=Formosa algae TaxID=225843 RepID=A0A9X0YH52_9FLAO|nr:DNA/RNA non-specific endonuclease [Formosa algae]MBP1838372.1 endonuclease G [Formosa algae]MDQ0334507.1 endonuclease G [Formosa algae]OEI79054.1 endonuclease [Formosa algae]PNW30096.1 endonuclease [Formosa algae]
MKKFLSIIGVIIIIGVYVYEQYLKTADTDVDEEYNEQPDLRNKKDNAYYLPTSTTGQIVYHNNYTLSYNEAHEQAEWVAYELKKSDIVYVDRKRPYFYEDKAVKTKSADWRSYKKSGYDKGHLCPAADRRKTVETYNETFLTSNISPQNHDFNAGIWNELEQTVRSWAKSYQDVYVVTGGVLKGDLKTIGKDQVSVPNYFYKIIFKADGAHSKMIAFLMPNRANEKKPIKSYVVSVDRIEAETGIDFFPKLEDALEIELEAKANTSDWRFR